MTRYLTEKEIILINHVIIKRYSPTEDIGVKDYSALQACIEQLKQVVFGKVVYPIIYDKAAILFEMLINKYCFYNGNKRTAVMAVYVFLKSNGILLHAPKKELEDKAVAIASLRGDDQLTRNEIREWLEQNSRLL